MSRSGYSDDGEHLELYRATVDKAIHGKRGQIFLRGLAGALDEMPVKRLIAGELITDTGEVCAIGAFCKTKGISVQGVDAYDADEVGKLVNIARSMAAEIEYENDERGHHDETPEARWKRVRDWVYSNIKLDGE